MDYPNGYERTGPGIPRPDANYGHGAQCDEVNVKAAADPMRNQYRLLSPYDADRVATVKALGAAFLATIGVNMPGREASIARTKIEEAVMWAVKGITG